MSSPAEFYYSLPPITKAYGTLCLMATVAFHLGLYHPASIALVYQLVFQRFQLEKGPFERRTADFLWMMIVGALSLLVLSAIPMLWTPFLGVSLVFMLLYIWSREFPNAQINIYGLVALKAFYLPWAMLALDVIFGSPILPDLLGIIAGHIYYFLTVLHPLSGGKNILKTPIWVHKLVARWGIGYQANAAVQQDRTAGVAFRGRGYRLDR